MGQRWWGLGALTLARAAMGFQFQSVAAVSPLISDSLGLDKSQLGWLIGLYLLPGIAFALPGGLLGARFGDKRLVLVGLGLMGTGGLWLSLASSFHEATAARVASGVGAVMLNVLVTKMVADWFEGRERFLAMSILINSWPIGIGLALLVLGPLGEAAGWRWGLVSSTVIAAAGFLLVLTIYRAPMPLTTPAPAHGLGLGQLDGKEWQLLVVCSLPWMLYNAAFQVEISFLPLILVQGGLGIQGAGGLVAVNTISFVVGVQAGGILLKRTARPDLVCGLALVAWSASLLLLTLDTSPLPWLVLGGLVGGIPAAALVSLPTEFLRVSRRGAGMGVFFTIYYLGCAILPGMAGGLYDRYGGQAAIWMAAGIGLSSVPILWLFRRLLPKAEQASIRTVDRRDADVSDSG
jgi:predicted MFS family arabinose efflux permease